MALWAEARSEAVWKEAAFLGVGVTEVASKGAVTAAAWDHRTRDRMKVG